MLTNEELIESLIKDVNNLVKNIAAGQYVQFCLLVTQITQKLLNLKSGIKSDMDNKNSVIESLKETIRSMGEDVVDMSVEEYMKNQMTKDGAENGGN